MTSPLVSSPVPVHPAGGADGLVSAQARMLYRSLAQQDVTPPARVATLLPDGDRTALGQLVQLGLVRRSPDGLVAVSRAELIDELLREQAGLLQTALDAVLERQRRIRTLISLDLDPGEQVQTVSLNGTGDASLYVMSNEAKRELFAIHPGASFSRRVLEQSLHKAETNLRAGVRLRVVHEPSALDDPDVVVYLRTLDELGAWVRLRRDVPFRLLMIDREVAVCTTSAESAEDTFVVRGRRVVGLMERVFETAWSDATPLRAMLDNRRTDPARGSGPTSRADRLRGRRGAVAEPVADRPDGPGQPGADGALSLEQRFASLSEQQRLILSCLAEGDTDRMIARRTGVTTRTVTRRIAEIYDVLGVESRFQAGVAAHRLGLV